MFLISHRGNTEGKNELLENNPVYILQAIEQGFDVEIDIRYIDGTLFLGHDTSQYKTSLDFLFSYSNKLWIHCKNVQAVSFLFKIDENKNLNYFWHEKDKVTLTSKRFIWAYPGIECQDSIAVLPEIYKDSLNGRLGICSDYINDYI